MSSNNNNMALVLAAKKAPFEILFFAQSENFDTSTKESKTVFLTQLTASIEDFGNVVETKKSLYTWGGISTAISAVASIIIMPVLVPVLAITSAVAIGGSCYDVSQQTSTAKQLKKYAVALKSVAAINWACLWEVAGTDIFLSCLNEASRGELIDDRLIRKGKSWDSALEFAASSLGVSSEHLFNILSQVKNRTLATDLNKSTSQSVPVIADSPVAQSLPSASNQSVAQSLPEMPDLQSLLSLPLPDRALAIIKLLDESGFDIARCIQKQVTVVAGSQRGGKGTLMGLLAILSTALKPVTKVHYFTAGDDVYPFKCDRLVCAKTYPYMPEPDLKVASELMNYLRDMERSSVGGYNDTVLVIDEAVALGEYISDEDTTWMVKFLLTRAAKKGARIFIVLHGNNLTSWTGTGKTGGFSSTFKQSAAFVGCESRSIKMSPLETIDVATGKYFIADPDNFGTAVSGGEIGTVPGWLLTEKNPLTGQPDPVRTLLTVFPELNTDIQKPKPQIQDAAPTRLHSANVPLQNPEPDIKDNIKVNETVKPSETPIFDNSEHYENENIEDENNDLDIKKSLSNDVILLSPQQIFNSNITIVDVSPEAYAVYFKIAKLSKSNDKIKLRDIVRERPLGRDTTTTEAVKYYCGDLVLAEVVNLENDVYSLVNNKSVRIQEK